MHKPEFIQENETHKLLWDFEMQTDHLISARKPDLVVIIQKKENLPNSGLCPPGGPQGENHRKRKEKQVLRPVDHRVKLKEGGKRDKY